MKLSPALPLTRSNALIAAIAAVLMVALWALPGCGGSTSPQGAGGNSAGAGHGGGTATGTGGNGTGGAIGGGGSTGTGSGGTGGVSVKVGTAQCSDGLDNDGDGKIDSADPECVGPLDNDESSFATGIPGDNIDACKQDCFFDGNSGMGDDGCQWQLQCDPLSNEPKCAYDPGYVQQHSRICSISDSQSQHCIDYCRPLTPNGCDCFGCCVVPGASTPIRLATTCKTTADFGDPSKCPPCTQVTSCINTCGHCELCLGKTTLPEDCQTGDGGIGTPDGGDGGGTPVPQCDPGIQPCGLGLPGCQEGTGCITGCCIPLPQ